MNDDLTKTLAENSDLTTLHNQGINVPATRYVQIKGDSLDYMLDMGK